MNLFEDYNDIGKKNITTTRNDLLDTIGIEGMQAIIKNVLLGGNVRDITEFITQCRLINSYASMVELFGKDLSDEVDINKYTDFVSKNLINSTGSEKILYLWMLGLTKKGLDNIVRSADNINDYKEKFVTSITETIEDLENTFGQLSGNIRIGDFQLNLNWNTFALLMLAIGSQTLSIRGSSKSMNGKLFEKLVLGSILSIYGFKYCNNPPKKIDKKEKLFWLSHMDEEERETDATIIYNGKAISVDIGFIGRGNPEISLDKVTRFGAYKRIGGIEHIMSTIIIVDTVGENSDIFNKAERVNGEIIQMKDKYWIYKFSSAISKRLKTNDILKDIKKEKLDSFLEENINKIDIKDFITN